MADLAAFIEARLAEEYASADMLAVQGPKWRLDKNDPAIVRSYYFHVAARCDDEELSNADLRAAHIVRYDPDRAKRDIAAKRLIVEELRAAAREHEDAATAATATRGSQFAAQDAERLLIKQVKHTILHRIAAAIAAVWATHPDYRTVWP